MTDLQSARIGTLAGVIWGIYAWFVFLFFVLLASIAALVTPGLARRRRLVAACARMPLLLAGVHMQVRGLEKIPSGSCVVVANHASYLDGVLLQGFLPPRFAYVVKGEMQKMPGMHFLLRRIGARFVERFDTSGSARDARRLLKAARAGESLALFPEGTFVRQPGLGRFRSGAFAAAIKAGLPVVPVVIQGSRHVFPAGAILPRYGQLRIDILNPIEPSSAAYADSRTLAALAREHMLGTLDEPDLLARVPARALQ